MHEKYGFTWHNFGWGGVNTCFAEHFANFSVKTQIKFTTSYLKLVDYATRYVGYYTDNKKTMVLTGVSGHGTPYWYLVGFDDFLLGKTVTLTCDNANFGFTSQNFKIDYLYSGDGYYVDIVGDAFPNPSIGIWVRSGRVPSGTYNLSISYGTSVLKAKFIVK